MIEIEAAFKVVKKGELIYLSIPAFEETGMVKHCFTTRVGGVSQGVYNSLNTSLDKEDPAENVLKNLDIVCSAIGIDYRKLVLTDQTHEDTIRIVTEADIGKGISVPNDITNTDGLMTNIPGIPLITFYADCVPLFFLDKRNRAIAVTHSGWRGTVKKIGAKTVRQMAEVYGTRPEDCLIGIGPSIGAECFEVGPEVAQEFMDSFAGWEEFVKPYGSEKYKIDLWQANKRMLMALGVPEANITISGFCTMCNEDLLFSYRRDKGRTGSLSAIMELKDNGC
ncbi:MAG TPA: peptidoglycan editing factor PgeF [Candidatus Nitrosocosmicus sp.]|nr:peptidoglycan editing factor PgeF [Candidatus Nitrosocosmicus sp.]